MKIRIKILIPFLIFLYVASNAQTKLGLQVGVSSSSLSSSYRPADYNLKRNNNITIGAVLVQKVYKNLSLRVEPQYITRGEELNWKRNNVKFIYETDLSYIDLPVYVAFDMSREKYHPYLFAGFNINFLLNAKVNLVNIPNDYILIDSDKLSNSNFSAEGGLGFSFRFDDHYEAQISAKYSMGLKNIYTPRNPIEFENYQASFAVLYTL